MMMVVVMLPPTKAEVCVTGNNRYVIACKLTLTSD